MENYKLIKNAFDPCSVDVDEQLYQNNAKKLITVNNAAYLKGSNCR
jgi:hypothetical protein